MKKRLIGLLDNEEMYASRLSRYLSESRKFPYSVCVFTTLGAFEEYGEKDKFEFLLAAEECIPHNYRGNILCLCEDRESVGIYKYSSADTIIDEIIRITGDEIKEENKNEQDSKTSFVGVFSPVGRSFKTSFSMVLGQILAKKYRVLYLNFESFSGMSVASSQRDKADLSDLLYYFKNLKKDFRRKFAESIQTVNGLEYISPAFYYLDLSYVTAEEWSEFLKMIKELGEYDYVILDLNDYLQGIFDVFLRKCDIIYTMTGGDSRAASKIFQYEEMLKYYEYSDVIDKTRKLRIPIIRNLPNEWERILYSEFADYIRKELKGDFNF